MLFLIFFLLPISIHSRIIPALGYLKCDFPKYHKKSGLYLYSRQYFGACDRVKQKIFCTMPFAEYYIKSCAENDHKCKCEDIFKDLIKNKVPIDDKDDKGIDDYYNQEEIDFEPFPSDITSKEYDYGDYDS